MVNARRFVSNLVPRGRRFGALSFALCATHAGAQTPVVQGPVIQQVIVTADVFNDRPNQGISTRIKGASLRVEQQIATLEATSLTAYRESTYSGGFDQDATAVPLVLILYEQPARQFSQELQLQSPGDDPLRGAR